MPKPKPRRKVKQHECNMPKCRKRSGLVLVAFGPTADSIKPVCPGCLPKALAHILRNAEFAMTCPNCACHFGA